MSISKRAGQTRAYPVKADTYFNGNVVVFLDATGHAVPFANALAADKAVGVSYIGVDNVSGVDGEEKVETTVGEHKLTNAGDITITDVGSDAYFSAVETVSISSATSTRPKAGKITQVDDDGVWIEFGV